MAVPVRISEGNYADLQHEADREKRSITAQLNLILEQRYGTPIGKDPLPQKLQIGKLSQPVEQVEQVEQAEYHPATPQKSEANASSVSDLLRPDLPDAKDILRANMEQPCCLNETRPCKHWVWDAQTGDGYKNTLSGRLMEVE